MKKIPNGRRFVFGIISLCLVFCVLGNTENQRKGVRCSAEWTGVHFGHLVVGKEFILYKFKREYDRKRVVEVETIPIEELVGVTYSYRFANVGRGMVAASSQVLVGGAEITDVLPLTGTAIMAIGTAGSILGVALTPAYVRNHEIIIAWKEGDQRKELALKLKRGRGAAKCLGELEKVSAGVWRNLNAEAQENVLAMELKRAFVIEGKTLMPGVFYLRLFPHSETSGEVLFFDAQFQSEFLTVERASLLDLRKVKRHFLGAVKVEIISELNDVDSPEVTYSEGGGRDTFIREIKLPKFTLKLE